MAQSSPNGSNRVPATGRDEIAKAISSEAETDPECSPLGDAYPVDLRLGVTYLRRCLRHLDGGRMVPVIVPYTPLGVARDIRTGYESVIAERLDGSGELYLFGLAEWASLEPREDDHVSDT